MANVTVIGGGVVGACSAYSLAAAGNNVTLLDRGIFGRGASHANCGYVCPSHVLPFAGPGAVWSTLTTLIQRNSPLTIRARTLLANLGWFLGFRRRCNTRDMLAAGAAIQSLLRSSRMVFDELIAAEHLDCEWETKGLLFMFRTRAAFEHYRHTDDLLRERFSTGSRCSRTSTQHRIDWNGLDQAAPGTLAARRDTLQ